MGRRFGRDKRGHSAGDGLRAGVRSSAVSWPSASTITIATMAVPASTSSPSVKLPVESLIRPITDGPAKPARLPIELMMAMPPAAAAPDRKAVGSVQNTGRTPKMPNPATLNATIFAVGSFRKAATVRPAAATKIGKAVWKRRSSFASERWPHQTMLITPTT